MTGRGRGAVAGPDCEARRPGVPAEPANTVSSLAFLPGAALLAVRTLGTAGGGAASDRLLAAALAANGVGSAWYHARAGRASGWGHDSAMAALLWLVAVGEAGGRARRRAELGGVAGLALAHAVVPASTPGVHLTVAASAAAALGRRVWRDARWRSPARPPAGRLAVPALLAAAGAACWAGGRPGSRWCRPASLLQPHAAWHVLAAVASTVVALDVADRRGPGPSGPRRAARRPAGTTSTLAGGADPA